VIATVMSPDVVHHVPITKGHNLSIGEKLVVIRRRHRFAKGSESLP
jgi:hypothetical protein